MHIATRGINSPVQFTACTQSSRPAKGDEDEKRRREEKALHEALRNTFPASTRYRLSGRCLSIVKCERDERSSATPCKRTPRPALASSSHTRADAVPFGAGLAFSKRFLPQVAKSCRITSTTILLATASNSKRIATWRFLNTPFQ